MSISVCHRRRFGVQTKVTVKTAHQAFIHSVLFITRRKNNSKLNFTLLQSNESEDQQMSQTSEARIHGERTIARPRTVL